MSVELGQVIRLSFQGKHVADIVAEDSYHITDAELEKIFGTLDISHPGVKKEKDRSARRMGEGLPL